MLPRNTSRALFDFSESLGLKSANTLNFGIKRVRDVQVVVVASVPAERLAVRNAFEIAEFDVVRIKNLCRPRRSRRLPRRRFGRR